jgi:hypothetical protein
VGLFIHFFVFCKKILRTLWVENLEKEEDHPKKNATSFSMVKKNHFLEQNK